MKTKEKEYKEPVKIKLTTIIILIFIILFSAICLIVFKDTNIIFTVGEDFEGLNTEFEIPKNAVEITDNEWIDILCPEGQFLVIPVIIIMLATIFMINKKYPNEKKLEIKEEMENRKTVVKQVLYGYKILLKMLLKFFLALIPIFVIHEFIHVFMMALFGDENIYVSFLGYAIVVASDYSDITKWQMILTQLMPAILFVLMIITTIIIYPKSKKKEIIMDLLILGFLGLSSTIPDWIGFYNVMKIVPNGCRIIETLESCYWYLPK